MPDSPAREILVTAARALAHAEGLGPSLQALVDAVAVQVGAASAAIVTVEGQPDRLVIAATYGLGEAARAGLAEAMRNPAHPIARTVASAAATFNVLPTVPGGPALRTHVPLIVTRHGADTVLGALALAHDAPIDPAVRPLLLASADLAAVAVERHRSA